MELLTSRLLRDDPHAAAFVQGRYDGITARSRWVMQSYARLLSRLAHLVYEELERLADEHKMDVRRLVWPLQKDSYELMSLPLEFRVAARGAFSMLSLANALVPGEVTKAKADALDEVARTEAPDNMNPPYDAGGADVKAVLIKFGKWAQYTFRNRQILPAWKMLSKQASREIAAMYEAFYGVPSTVEDGLRYLMWDIQEGLVRTTSPFPLPYATRVSLALVMRWVLQMRMLGRVQPLIG